MESNMSESYQKLRKDFKDLDFTDRLTFLAESLLLTGQSAIVGGLEVAGSVAAEGGRITNDMSSP